MLEHPGKDKEFTITGEELWQLGIWDEMQGGNRYYVHKKNEIYDEIVRRGEK